MLQIEFAIQHTAESNTGVKWQKKSIEGVFLKANFPHPPHPADYTQLENNSATLVSLNL